MKRNSDCLHAEGHIAQINTVYDSLSGFWIDWSSHRCGVCIWDGIIVCVLVYACECICGLVCVHTGVVCVHTGVVCAHTGVVCAHKEWCVCTQGLCVRIRSGMYAYKGCVCA